jgi:16S rRNA (cytosine1402-N4)-methyltransferase
MESTSNSPADWASEYHTPVLVNEVLALLPCPGRVLDCTLGGGGHSAALLAGGCDVIGLDRDPDAIRVAEARLESYKGAGRFRAVLENYASVDDVAELRDVRFNGILLDLGVSTHQVDAFERGFTFREGARLDMRMDGAPRTAADVLRDTPVDELARLFREHADEPRARRLAAEIDRRRRTRPFHTSDDLVGAIRATLGPRSGAPDFARLFQAIRIVVNDELTGLAHALPALRDRLTDGGVLVVIAYHSGEDRLVKRALAEWSASCVCPPKQPMCNCRGAALGSLLTKKAMTASEAEVASNPRSRSARLRAWRKSG